MCLNFVAPGMVGGKKKESRIALYTSYLETKQTPVEEDSTSNVLGLVSGVRCAHTHFSIGDECTDSSLGVR